MRLVITNFKHETIAEIGWFEGGLPRIGERLLIPSDEGLPLQARVLGVGHDLFKRYEGILVEHDHPTVTVRVDA